jgi:two-component system, NarL family, nitrate/nitrite response regulator NarL
MNRTLTAVLADDHAAVLENVSRCLSTICEVVAAVRDGSAAVEAIIRLRPDIAVLDIAMPELDGIGVAREVKLKGSHTKVVFLTVQEDEDYISAALESGALGYVLKGRMRLDLPQAIEHAVAGVIFVSSRFRRQHSHHPHL